MLSFFRACAFGLMLTSPAALAITPEAMINRILEVGQDVVQQGNIVNFRVQGIPLTLVFDENADRMRLVSPIVETKDVGDDVLVMAMEANFHSVLDARYAISNDIVWSAFMHPLADLSPALLDSAISQVAIAHASFGTEFTSGALFFPNRGE